MIKIDKIDLTFGEFFSFTKKEKMFVRVCVWHTDKQTNKQTNTSKDVYENVKSKCGKKETWFFFGLFEMPNRPTGINKPKTILSLSLSLSLSLVWHCFFFFLLFHQFNYIINFCFLLNFFLKMFFFVLFSFSWRLLFFVFCCTE